MSSEIQKLNMEKQLQAVPVRNEHLSEERVEKGLKITLEPTQDKKSKQQRLILEGLGLQLFEQVNNQITVDEMVTDFQAAHLLSFFEAHNLVVQYIDSLVSWGLIGLTWPSADEA